MKRNMIIAIVMLGILSGCSSNNPPTSSNTSDTVINSGGEKTTTVSENYEEKTEEAFYDWRGVKLYYPSSFEKEVLDSTTLWSGVNSHNDSVYYLAKANMSCEESIELIAVPDTLEEYVYDTVNYKYASYESKFGISSDYESQMSYSGYDFIKRCGTIHCETESESHDLAYAAYYGIIDFPDYGKNNIPVVWMAFSEAKDSATEKELELIVDKAAELLNWE